MSEAALVFENLTLGYDKHPVVHHLDASISRGALLAVAGPNGGGKSTLLKAVAGLLNPLQGKIELGALEPRDIAYLPQLSEIDTSFPMSVYDLAATGLWRGTGASRAMSKACRTQIDAALKTVGLEHFADRQIGTLSGGQLQRALFARVILQDAKLILLDEPFGAIDEQTVEDLLNLIKFWNAERRTVITVIHDFACIKKYFPLTLLLARSKIAFGKTAEVLSTENMERARKMPAPADPHAPPCPQAA